MIQRQRSGGPLGLSQLRALKTIVGSRSSQHHSSNWQQRGPFKILKKRGFGQNQGKSLPIKGHGMSKEDILKVLGKSIPCEVSCRKKTNYSFSHISNPQITSTFHWPSSISTSINISINKSTSTIPLMVSYPSKRTK